MAIGKDIIELQKKIKYSFSDISILEKALTHSSYSYEMKSKGLELSSNERLEFLGDAVLQLVISEHLYEAHRDLAEGALTKMRQYLVCEKTLSKIARQIDLGDYINLGRGEENSDCRSRPKVLADALEAVIAAVYIDSKEKAEKTTEKMIFSLFENEISESRNMQKGDYKTMLQQLVEKDGAAELEYRIISECGPEHSKLFSVEALVNNNIVGKGSAQTKKEAEMAAAREALVLFGVIV